MQHNQVGRSGLVVSELSLGTMLFGEGQALDQVSALPYSYPYSMIRAYGME